MDKKREEAHNFEVATAMYDGGMKFQQKEHERNNMRNLLFTLLNLLVIAAAIFVIAFVVFKGFLGQNETKIHVNHPDEKTIINIARPPYKEKARMARFIVHKSQWGVMTTFCTHNKGYPWGEVVSVSDGLANASTGIPLIYISPMDVAAKDFTANPNVSFTFSEAEGHWCHKNKIDPEDPRCARIHLFGKIVKLTPDEIPAAKKSMFTRHPVMATWPASHQWFFAKIDLTKVEVLDYFGPISDVTVEEYLKAKP